MGNLLAAAGTSILSSMLGNWGKRRAQKRQNQFNVDFWNMQNEYNTPTQQMQRLRDANLNPNLVYGNGTVANTADKIAPSASQDHKFESPLKDMNTYANTQRTQANTDNLAVQNHLLKQETILKAIETSTKGIENSKSAIDLNSAQELKDLSVDFAKENLRQMESKTLGIDHDNNIKNKGTRDILKKMQYEAEYARKNQEGKSLDNKLKQIEIDLQKLGLDSQSPWYAKILGRNWETIGRALYQEH